MDSLSQAASASNNPLIQAASQEFFERVSRGEEVDVEEFLLRHLEISTELRAIITSGLPQSPPAATPQPSRPIRPDAPSAPPAKTSTRSVIASASDTASGKRKRSSQPAADDLPEVFGRYRIQQKLGEGAMGAVYLAEDTLLQRNVALKTPTFEDDEDGEMLKRFFREARAVASLKHPSLCAVYDVGEIDGRYYISMEYVPGRKLQSFIKPDNPMSEKQAASVIRKIALGMQAAHTQGVIHRDLKPDNVMINQKGEPVVMDFGLVHKLDSKDSTRLTHHGTIVGSPAYMSKEQVEGNTTSLTAATDQYSLGVIFYQLLTSQLPFDGGLHAVLAAILTRDPAPLSELRPGLNPKLEAICLRMMSKSAADRFPSMKAVADAIAAATKGTATDTVRTESSAADVWKVARTVAYQWWRAQPPPYRWTILGAASVCLVFLASVLFFRNGEALVKIEIESNDVEVTFQKETFTFADGEKQYRVRPGTQTLHIKSGDVEFDTKQFTLKRGENPVITVELVKSEIVTKLGAKEIGRRSLSVSSTNQPTTMKGTISSGGAGWHGWPTDAPAPAIAPFDAAQAKQHQNAWAAYLKVPVEYTNSIGMKFRLVPPGEFLMGSTPAERESQTVSLEVAKKYNWKNNGEDWNKQMRSEGPQHTVILTRPIYLGVNEVTQAEYEKVMGKNPSHFSSTGAGKSAVTGRDTSSHPVETVSWNDAAEFCAKLSLQEKLKPFYFREGEAITLLAGTGYRLPTEAEWEYACRAGTTTAFWIDGDEDNLVKAGWANWLRTNAGLRTHSVGKLQMNPFGLFDMHGNVAEWVQDWYEASYYGEFSDISAIDPICLASESSQRGARGGGWGNFAAGCRSANRIAISPTLPNSDTGFRVALPVNAAKVERTTTVVPAIGAPQPPAVEAK